MQIKAPLSFQFEVYGFLIFIVGLFLSGLPEIGGYISLICWLISLILAGSGIYFGLQERKMEASQKSNLSVVAVVIGVVILVTLLIFILIGFLSSTPSENAQGAYKF